MTFGEKLQLLRKQNGFSQEKLSEQLKISRQAISKWELGESLPDTENVVRLSKLFSVSIDYLLNEEIHSENDIPAVQNNTVVMQNRFRVKMRLIIGSVCTALGSIGGITLFVLSTMIPVHVTKQRLLPDGSIQYYGGGDILGYDFFTFIQEYRLQALFAIFTILIVSGILLIWASNRSSQS